MEKITLPGKLIEFNKEASSGLQLHNMVESLVTSPPFGHPSGGGEGGVGNEEKQTVLLENTRNIYGATHSDGHSFEGGYERNNEHYDDISIKGLIINQIETLPQNEKFPSAGGVSAGQGGQTSEENNTPNTEDVYAGRGGQTSEENNTPNTEDIYAGGGVQTSEEKNTPNKEDMSAGCGGQTSEVKNTYNKEEINEAHGGQSPGGRHARSVEEHIPRNTKNFMSLPYNPKLKKRARALRKAGNLPEVLFWLQVKNKKFKGYDFDRQKIVGNYIVDFYCGNCNVVVEIDGSSHDYKQAYDAIRDSYLQAQGLIVIHIPVVDIMKNMYEVMKMLHNHPALQHPLP